MSANQVLGNARFMPLQDKTVQTIITSPPYFGLRSYGGLSSTWGGNPFCNHLFVNDSTMRQMTGGTGPASKKQITNKGGQFGNDGTVIPSATCIYCCAWHGELGAEATPGQYIDHLVEVISECRRVLKDDGVMFLNISDSYAGSGRGPTGKNGIQNAETRQGFTGGGGLHRKALTAGAIGNAWVPPAKGFRQKSLYLIPERLAIALSDDGWVIRNRIAWCKAAPMPGSQRDRFTSAWEHIWVVTKRGQYYWDHAATQEPGVTVSSRNMRDYWVLKPDPYRGAHYATFPRELPRRCILVSSRPGDVVLDPFSGSGTVAYMANILGRKGVGIELSHQYVEETRTTGRLSGNH